jgi:hypothetical protein
MSNSKPAAKINRTQVYHHQGGLDKGTRKTSVRTQTASALAIYFCWRRSPIRPTVSPANSVDMIVKRSSPKSSSRHHPLRFRLRQAALALYASAQWSIASSFPTVLFKQLDAGPEFQPCRFITASNSRVFKVNITVASALILRFSRRRMLQPNKTDSKLCASLTRHASGRRPGAVADGSTCKGGMAPRCIPRQRLCAARRYA